MTEHLGGRLGGHYVAYTHGGGGWDYISDSSVSASSESAVLAAQAYMLWYRRVS